MTLLRIGGLPLEHILGWAEFAGLRIAVEPRVFVPRHRTEFLAEQAVALALAAGAPAAPAASAAPAHRPVVLDLCCGSGAIAAFAAAQLGDVELWAADIDPAAVRSARRNLPEPARVVEGDLFDALPESLAGRVDVLVANTPYVPTAAIATMPPEAREYEDRVALDGGLDGLDLQRRVATDAPHWLAPGGHLLVETSTQQAPVAARIFARAGLEASIRHSEEHDATIVIGRRAEPNEH